MRKFTAFLALLIALAFKAEAQKTKIHGTVTDGAQKTIESATISLLRAKDSTAAKFTVATKTGQYVFEGMPFGKYLVMVTAVGHQKTFSSVVELSAAAETVEIPTLELKPQPKALSGVTVTARRPLVEQKIDRTIVNVEAAITNAGTNALEVLEKSPGISVDKDGNISLKGKAGVVVLVDGRPTQLGAADLANMLRNMQSSGLDQIEIMTNPPAKYDAAGNAGVINIKTKRNKQMGYSGTLGVTLAHGRHPRTNENASIAYRHNRLNVYGNFSHGYRRQTQDLYLQRNFLHRSTKEVVNRFEQAAELTNESNSFNGKVGLDYNISKKTTVGAVVSGFTGPNQFGGNTVTNDVALSKLQGITRSVSLNREVFRNLSNNLNFRTVLDSAGAELTADLDYLVYDGQSDVSLTNRYFSGNGVLQRADTLYGDLPQAIHIYSGKADYTKPIKGGRFEAGIKYSQVNTDNDARYDTSSNGTVLRDYSRSNHFLYEEAIGAAYVNFSKALSKKWNAQLGLRYEETRANGLSKGHRFESSTNRFIPHDTTFKLHYRQLFPTLYLQYAASEKNSFVLNYGRRIRRPNYESLNPFIEFIDRYTYQQGNPNLRPQFSHNIELSHTYRSFLTTTLNYTSTNNIIQQVIEQNTEKSETFIRQANIAKQRQYGVSVSAGKPINKWWTSNIYVNVFNNRFEGIVNNSAIDLSATTLMLNGSQQFKLGKTTSAEVSGWFRTTGLEGVLKIRQIGMMNVGFSQQVMKGKGSLRLTVRDVFSTQHFKGESRFSDVDVQFQNYNDSRAVSLGFTYRFSKGKVNGPKRRNSSAADEQSRVGGGNNQ